MSGYPFDTLSFSSLNSFMGYGSCQLAWAFDRIENRPPDRPKSQRLVLGTAFEAGTIAAYNAVIDGETPEVDAAIGASIDAWNEEMGTGEYANDEWSGLPGLLPSAVREYVTDVVPQVRPIELQHSFRIPFEEVSWEMSGRIDLLHELLDGTEGLVDTKATASGTKYQPDEDLQLNLYALTRQYETGTPPTEIGFDAAVILKTTARIERPRAAVTPASLERAADLLSDGALMIDEACASGRFLPTARLARSWKCQSRFCDFYDHTCPYGARGRRAPES